MLKSLLPSVTKRHVERKLLQTPPRHLFRIIKDVDAYKEFLPLCSHSQVLQKSNCGQYFDAVLRVGLEPLFSEEYTSRVAVQNEHPYKVTSKSIQSTLFDSLTSTWILRDAQHENDECCDVDFTVEMTVSDPVVAGVLDQVLKEVAGRQVEAFEKRCQQLPFKEFEQELKQ